MNIDLKPKYNYMSMYYLNKCSETMTKYNENINNRGRFTLLSKINTSLKLCAYSIAFVATLIFEKSIKYFRRKEYEKKLKVQIQTDIANFKSEHCNLTEIQKDIHQFVVNEHLFLDKDPQQIAKYEERALSCYASSYMHYSPVVVEWVHSILETAMAFTPPKRVVFLARDGIAPYQVAQILQKKYPEKYDNIPLSLLYISRVVKDWSTKNEANKQTFIDYVQQEGLKLNEKCLFIDIGFKGSMIQPIKELLKDLTPDIQFGYLISHTQKAHGYMANRDINMESVRAAGQNPAIHWLEDTLQGVQNTATKLFRDQSGGVHPYIINKKGHTTCKEDVPKSYLFKHFGLKGIIDGANDTTITTPYINEKNGKPQQWNMASQKLKETFDRFLMQYVIGKRVSCTKHI